MATIANFTPDPIEWWHVGVNGVIQPGEIVENMDEGRARHILNKFGNIGLIQLNFKDDIEEKKKAAMRQWRAFWERMIESHNQSNEDAKEKGNRYTKPTHDLEEKAKLFGLELLRPWRVERKDNEEIATLKSENQSLKQSLNSMQEQMTKMFEMLSSKQTNSGPTSITIDAEKALNTIIEMNQNRYKRLSETNMKTWVAKNLKDIADMPEANKNEIKAKYDEFYKEPFPTEVSI